MNIPPLNLTCPNCHARLEAQAADLLVCPNDGREYLCEEGIWRCLLPERAQYYARFLQEYETVRLAEGRGSRDPQYYRALPFEDLSGRSGKDWHIRARSFTTFVKQVLSPLEHEQGAAMKILDLGAGNGWLSNRLAQRGHCLAAIDLRTGELDGLGALRYYNSAILAVQAEFDRLPFMDDEFDLAIFNASLHYTSDYATTLEEALRVLVPSGRLAIIDSPLYHQAKSGQAMVSERQGRFKRLYGFPSNALPSQDFLTPAQLEKLSHDLGLSWQTIWPFFGLGWLLRPWRARLRGQREPASFPVLVGRYL